MGRAGEGAGWVGWLGVVIWGIIGIFRKGFSVFAVKKMVFLYRTLWFGRTAETGMIGTIG